MPSMVERGGSEGGVKGERLVDVIGVTREITRRSVTSSRAFDISPRSFRVSLRHLLQAISAIGLVALCR